MVMVPSRASSRERYEPTRHSDVRCAACSCRSLERMCCTAFRLSPWGCACSSSKKSESESESDSETSPPRLNGRRLSPRGHIARPLASRGRQSRRREAKSDWVDGGSACSVAAHSATICNFARGLCTALSAIRPSFLVGGPSKLEHSVGIAGASRHLILVHAAVAWSLRRSECACRSLSFRLQSVTKNACMCGAHW